jgi:hypothetical protein
MTVLDRTLHRLATTTFTISSGNPDLTRIPTLLGGGIDIIGVEPSDTAVERCPPRPFTV